MCVCVGGGGGRHKKQQRITVSRRLVLSSDIAAHVHLLATHHKAMYIYI